MHPHLARQIVMSQEKSIEPSPAAASSEKASYDWKAIIDDLNALLRLRTTPIGMKMFSTVEEMEAIPKFGGPSQFTPLTRSSRKPRGWDGPSVSR